MPAIAPLDNPPLLDEDVVVSVTLTSAGFGLDVGYTMTIELGDLMVLPLAQVTAVIDSARPSNDAPLSRLIAVPARMVPAKVAPAPIVAAVPTSQNTLLAWAPLIRISDVDVAVVSVVAVWNIHTDVLFP
jgi:hypothetical protein